MNRIINNDYNDYNETGVTSAIGAASTTANHDEPIHDLRHDETVASDGGNDYNNGVVDIVPYHHDELDVYEGTEDVMGLAISPAIVSHAARTDHSVDAYEQVVMLVHQVLARRQAFMALGLDITDEQTFASSLLELQTLETLLAQVALEGRRLVQVAMRHVKAEEDEERRHQDYMVAAQLDEDWHDKLENAREQVFSKMVSCFALSVSGRVLVGVYFRFHRLAEGGMDGVLDGVNGYLMGQCKEVVIVSMTMNAFKMIGLAGDSGPMSTALDVVAAAPCYAAHIGLCGAAAWALFKVSKHAPLAAKMVVYTAGAVVYSGVSIVDVCACALACAAPMIYVAMEYGHFVRMNSGKTPTTQAVTQLLVSFDEAVSVGLSMLCISCVIHFCKESTGWAL
ncbi:hypothetical protein MPSEU_000362000 [Mayamaea pseudoterrestris]|nr:hypothetical protein MPSEU_000362000 [Mayamaea pseudoterrestris]